jgi:hypothetical protein
MRVKHIWPVLAIALLLISGLAGCAGAGSTPQGQATPAATEATAASESNGNSAYPAPATPSSNSAYPGPAANAPTADSAYPAPQAQPTAAGRDPEPIPQPAAGMGVVHGMVYSVTTDQPIYDGVIVYLSPVINTDNAAMDAVSLDLEGDPKATPDNQGGFAFADVPPGRYGIVVQTPLSQHLAHYADDQSKDVILTVEAGQTLDLGKLLSAYP